MPRTIKLESDLLLINVLSVALILTIVFMPDFPLRVILGVPFVLFFSGYALICALFPKKGDLDGIERFALSIGLSLAVVPLIGLVLNYTPWGIRLFPVLISLSFFVLAMSIIAAYRRKNLPPSERFVPSANLPRWSELNKSDRLALVGFIACIAIAGGIVAYFVSMPKIGERFTEFYVLGPGGKIADYPTDLRLGESGTVILGIINHEYGNVTYKIVVKFENETIATTDGITLSHEGKWEQNFTFTPNKVGEKMKLEFLLFREGVEEPYRTLHLWITVRPGE